MLKRFENKLRMFNTVWQVIKKFKTLWENNNGFNDVVSDYEKGINAINETRKITDGDATGITTDKIEMQDQLMDSIMEISGPFGTVAIRTGNNELKKQVYFTDSYLDDLTEAELANTGIMLAEMAAGYTDQLSNFGIGNDDIAQLKDIAEKYKNKIAEPRAKISERVAANEKLAQLFSQYSLLLKDQLDGMVDKYRRSNPEFWSEYFAARKIVDYGIRHEKKDESTNAA